MSNPYGCHHLINRRLAAHEQLLVRLLARMAVNMVVTRHRRCHETGATHAGIEFVWLVPMSTFGCCVPDLLR